LWFLLLVDSMVTSQFIQVNLNWNWLIDWGISFYLKCQLTTEYSTSLTDKTRYLYTVLISLNTQEPLALAYESQFKVEQQLGFVGGVRATDFSIYEMCSVEWVIVWNDWAQDLSMWLQRSIANPAWFGKRFKSHWIRYAKTKCSAWSGITCSLCDVYIPGSPCLVWKKNQEALTYLYFEVLSMERVNMQSVWCWHAVQPSTWCGKRFKNH
jgi:hypothetical protein